MTMSAPSSRSARISAMASRALRSPAGSPCGRRRPRWSRRPRRGTGRRGRRRTWPRRPGCATCSWPEPSSAARMAPTWPSIIPLGAHTSAPASAWASATRAYSSRVASLSTSPWASTTPQWPWSVYSSRHRSAMQHHLVAEVVAQVAQRELHDAVGIPGARADARPWSTGTPNRMTPGHAERRPARPPPCAATRGCAGPGRAARRWAAGRRCPRGRTAARPGRRPTAASRPRAAAARGCVAAGAGVARGRSPPPAYGDAASVVDERGHQTRRRWARPPRRRRGVRAAGRWPR